VNSYLDNPSTAILDHVASRPRSRRKTSFEVDMDKVAAAKAILGTSTLTETVDAALAEIQDAERRRALAKLLFEPGSVDIDGSGERTDAWR